MVAITQIPTHKMHKNKKHKIIFIFICKTKQHFLPFFFNIFRVLQLIKHESNCPSLSCPSHNYVEWTPRKTTTTTRKKTTIFKLNFNLCKSKINWIIFSKMINRHCFCGVMFELLWVKTFFILIQNEFLFYFYFVYFLHFFFYIHTYIYKFLLSSFYDEILLFIIIR